MTRTVEPAGRAFAVALLVPAFVAAGCGDSTGPPPSPSDLTGAWSFSYVAVDSTLCPIPEIQQGCGGGGRLDLVQQGQRVTGSWTAGGGCQTCGSAWDYGGGGPFRSEFSWTTLEFGLQGCEFSADLPSGRVDEVNGTVRCGLAPDQVARGTWRMTRMP
jgi:hypothetical protein